MISQKVPGTGRKHPTLERDLILKYVIGDATEPHEKPAIIAHICNDLGVAGKGFVVPLYRKYPKARNRYRELFRFKMEDYPFQAGLGQAQLVQLSEDLVIANMIAQHGITWVGGIPPIRYDALRMALATVYAHARTARFSVHMPRIGAGLAGGSWEKIEPIILEAMTMDTYVYTLESEKEKYG